MAASFRLVKYGYGSIPINTIFSGMNIHLPAILMFTRGTRLFWGSLGTRVLTHPHIVIIIHSWNFYETKIRGSTLWMALPWQEAGHPEQALSLGSWKKWGSETWGNELPRYGKFGEHWWLASRLWRFPPNFQTQMMGRSGWEEIGSIWLAVSNLLYTRLVDFPPLECTDKVHISKHYSQHVQHMVGFQPCCGFGSTIGFWWDMTEFLPFIYTSFLPLPAWICWMQSLWKESPLVPSTISRIYWRLAVFFF